jgi:hypothetical protein
MRLRCLVDNHTPFKAGKFYEVAEILELPGHAMVRKPNGKWPKPFEPYFAWHADEIFEPSPNGIPAYSCGYRYEELEFFGTIVPHSIFGEPRTGTYPRKPSAQEERLEQLVDKYGKGHLWWTVYRGVLNNVTCPDGLERQFLLIGAHHWKLGRSCSYSDAIRGIETILRQLKIRVSAVAPIDDQQIEFWCRSFYRKPGPWTWTWRLPTVRRQKSTD